MKSVYIKNRFLFFKSARLIFNNRLFLDLVKENKYSLIVLITQEKLKTLKGVKEKIKKTTNISLEGDTDSVLAGFNNTTRNEIRRTFKIENLKFKKEKKITNNIYEIYKKFRRDKNLPLQDKDFLESADLYAAHLNDRPISFITVYDIFPYLRIQNIFSDESDQEIRNTIGYSTRRLIYEICKHGSEGGYSFLDMAGVNLTDPKKQGITRFKMGFGGELADEYTYTYKSPFLNKVTRLIKKA